MNALPHIREKDRTLVAAAIDKLVARIQPEGIICYGVRTESKARWSCFAQSDEGEPSITLDLLVITQETDKRHRDQVIDTIEGLGSEIRFVPVVHSVEAVKAGLKAVTRPEKSLHFLVKSPETNLHFLVSPERALHLFTG